jgi:hypothetical protein
MCAAIEVGQVDRSVIFPIRHYIHILFLHRYFTSSHVWKQTQETSETAVFLDVHWCDYHGEQSPCYLIGT